MGSGETSEAADRQWKECIYCGAMGRHMIWVGMEGWSHDHCHQGYIDAQTETIADIQKLAPYTDYGILEEDLIEELGDEQ